MPQENELVVLGADADIVAVAETLLFVRHKSLGIRELTREKVALIKDAYHDSSTAQHVAELLQTYSTTHKHALVIRDFEGSGYEGEGIPALEKDIKDSLLLKGWNSDRIEVVVIEPEVEAWLRFDSAHLEELVRKEKKANHDLLSNAFQKKVSEVIDQEGGILPNSKPARPKEVFEAVLAAYKVPNSASVFRKLAAKESLKGCTVPSFVKLVATLANWFRA